MIRLRNVFLAAATGVVLSLLGQICARGETAKTPKPNIVFILADDLGYGDLGCYGQKEIQTPNIDKLAKEGMRFTDAYAASPICAPSRCGLLTGLHTGHALIRGNTKVSLGPADTTVEELLKTAGYQTGAMGKWGVGEPGSEGTPTKKGFDYFYGFIDQTHAHNSYPSYLFRNEEKVKLRNVVPNEGPYGQGVATEKADFAPDLFETEALSYLDKVSPDKPFFLYFPTTIPHANNEAHAVEVPDLAPYTDKDWPESEKRYAAAITRLDAQVGRLMQRLHDRHLDENTLVIFASDNGAHQEGSNTADFFHSSGPLRGIKRDMYEGGYRVPFIARWPGHIQPNSTSEYPIVFYDFLPTAAEMAGIAPPNNIDGISFLPTLLGQPQTNTHDFLYWEYHERGFEQAVRMVSWKAVRHGIDQPLELYDLKDDLAEAHNVAAQNPEIVAKITDYMKTARTDSKDFPVRAASPKGRTSAAPTAPKQPGTAEDSKAK
jgi:arylsulfatase A-like enzyme